MTTLQSIVSVVMNARYSRKLFTENPFSFNRAVREVVVLR